MTDYRLDILYQQGLLNNRYHHMDMTRRVPLYIQPVQNFHTPYVITNQFDRNSVVSLFQANAQDLTYPKIICQKPGREGSSRFNYAIDNYVTNRLVDVSGQAYRNSALRIQPNKYTTPAKIKA